MEIIKKKLLSLTATHLCTPRLPNTQNSRFVGLFPNAKNLGFVQNGRLMITDHIRKVYQMVYWTLHFLRSHAAHTPFEVSHMSIVRTLWCLLELIPQSRGRLSLHSRLVCVIYIWIWSRFSLGVDWNGSFVGE
jgi:hypothetical protein